jgi:2-keto-4-pentenoate hydratase/2-oxohepta-3-ene-1,7-dioic acid hydratase in catechol pathway
MGGDVAYGVVEEEQGGGPTPAPGLESHTGASAAGADRPLVIAELRGHPFDFEGELAVIIGRLCREVPLERAQDVIFGYTCANDVTARDLQSRDGQWTRAKGFDTFCPIGPWIETQADPTDLGLTTSVNGEIKQHARTSEMVHDVPTLIAFVSQVMTLLPGDVILTGTPAGVGPLQHGDEVSVTIESIGTLRNRVIIRD